jgi:hypothetical protein
MVPKRPPSGHHEGVRHRLPARLAAAVAALVACGALACGALAGCGGGNAGSPGSGTVRCGTARTAAGVPVEIEVTSGPVACHDALAIEHAYTREVASGHVPGNGGGAPVRIGGWVCQGFNTPKVLATGHASACRKHGAETLAVLPRPGPAGSSL